MKRLPVVWSPLGVLGYARTERGALQVCERYIDKASYERFSVTRKVLPEDGPCVSGEVWACGMVMAPCAVRAPTERTHRKEVKV